MTDFKEKLIRELDQQYVRNAVQKKEDELYWQGYEVGKQKIATGHWTSPTNLTAEEYDWWWAGFCGGTSDARAKAH